MNNIKQQIPIQRYPESRFEVMVEVKNKIESAGRYRLHTRLKDHVEGYTQKINDHSYSNILRGKASLELLFVFLNAINTLIQIEANQAEIDNQVKKGYSPPIHTA